jgi:hypothetical protein
MIVALLALASMGTPAVTQRVPLYRDRQLAFTVEIPRSWGYSKQGFESCHYRSVQICANNRGVDSLRVVTWWEAQPNGGRRGTFGPEAFEHELSPGTVYIDLAMCSGPGGFVGGRPYVWSPDKGPSARIALAAKARTPGAETDGLVLYRVSFVRWGWPWEAYIAGRKPFDREDLDTAFGILTSLRFPDVPVCDPHQAVEVAIPNLPVEFRPQPGWLEDCGYMFHYRVDADTSASGFKVSFTVLDGTEDRRVVRSTSYHVGRAGDVTAVAKLRE